MSAEIPAGMKLVRVFDLAGKPVTGLRADIRSRKPDGTLNYEWQEPDAIMVEMKSVAIETRTEHDWKYGQSPAESIRVPVKTRWLSWRWEDYGCGYSGIRLTKQLGQGETIPNDCIAIEDRTP